MAAGSGKFTLKESEKRIAAKIDSAHIPGSPNDGQEYSYLLDEFQNPDDLITSTYFQNERIWAQKKQTGMTLVWTADPHGRVGIRLVSLVMFKLRECQENYQFMCIIFSCHVTY